jgi:SET domain-containing protein
MSKDKLYRPLPAEVTIRESGIEGLGLFATVDIYKGQEIGITHVKDDEFDDGFIRTPLGGFFNHSDCPNCEAYELVRFIMLRAIKNIAKESEITVSYWLPSYAHFHSV